LSARDLDSIDLSKYLDKESTKQSEAKKQLGPFIDRSFEVRETHV